MTLGCFRAMKTALWKQFSTAQPMQQSIHNVPKQNIDSYTESKAKGQNPCYNRGCLKYARKQTLSNT